MPYVTGDQFTFQETLILLPALLQNHIDNILHGIILQIYIVSERENRVVRSISFVLLIRYIPGIFIIKPWFLRDGDFNGIKRQTDTHPQFMIYQIVFHIYVLKPIKTFQHDLPLPISLTRVYLFTNLFQTNIIHPDVWPT